jgi:glycosyltransferase involved in cell wall biosynthesis
VGPVIGYIGRLTRDKGLEDLFQAWRVLREEFPASRLLLVGPWESENAVSQVCRDGLHGDDRVIMTGAQDDVASFYKTMDLFVFPSHGTEGFPNAPMEAAAMGLPVVATRVVGCVDAVADGVTGTVISPRAPGELETTLRMYLCNPDLRAGHGAAGRERIRTGFDPHDLWAEFRDYYFHLLRREGLPLPAQQPDSESLPKAA